MLESINGARETITFETYIYWSGDIGVHQFARRPGSHMDAKVVRRASRADWGPLIGSGKVPCSDPACRQ